MNKIIILFAFLFLCGCSQNVDLTVCNDQDCFDEKFAACEKASITFDMGMASYTYEILGFQNGNCYMKTFYPTNINPDFTDKEMYCGYDNTKDFTSATAEVIASFSRGDELGDCYGELYNLMTGKTVNVEAEEPVEPEPVGVDEPVEPEPVEVDECSNDNDCDDNDASTEDECSGSPRECSNDEIDYCYSGDGYCPDGCEYNDDNDCDEPVEVDECSVDSDCDDNDASTEDECSGTPLVCSNELITSCVSNDGYCADGCSFDNDDDCEEVNDDECSVDSDCDDNNDFTKDECSGSECVFTLVDYCYGGDGICPDDCMFHNDNDCDRLDPYDSSYPLVIDLITEQDTYEIEETFNGALPYLEYSGPPFEGAIIYTRYREGFVDSDAYDILYKGYLEKIDSHDLNDSMFRAGYPMQACRIYEYRTGDAPNEFFDHEGTYVYGMHVYDCLDIENEGYEWLKQGKAKGGLVRWYLIKNLGLSIR